MMRNYSLVIATLFASFAISSFANASCSTRPLGEVEETLVRAISDRLIKTGVKGVAFATPTANGARMYMTVGGGLTFAIYNSGGMVQQIQTAALKDNDVDLDRMLTLVSFVVTRFSSENEQAVKQAAYRLFEQAKKGRPQSQNWGDNVIVAEFVDRSPVLTVGKRVCS